MACQPSDQAGPPTASCPLGHISAQSPEARLACDPLPSVGHRTGKPGPSMQDPEYARPGLAHPSSVAQLQVGKLRHGPISQPLSGPADLVIELVYPTHSGACRGPQLSLGSWNDSSEASLKKREIDYLCLPVAHPTNKNLLFGFLPESVLWWVRLEVGRGRGGPGGNKGVTHCTAQSRGWPRRLLQGARAAHPLLHSGWGGLAAPAPSWLLLCPPWSALSFLGSCELLILQGRARCHLL